MTKTYTMRPPAFDDLKDAVEMFRRYEQHIEGEMESELETVKTDWSFPAFDLERDALMIVDSEENIVGFTAVYNDNSPYIHNFIVHKVEPEHIGSQIEIDLADWAEKRSNENMSKAPDDAEVFMGAFVFNQDQKRIDQLKSRGFVEKRYFQRMDINLDKELTEPSFPEGITIETHAQRGSLEDILHCDRASFKDHWGYFETPFEEDLKEWEHWIKGEPYYDPRYWFLACSEGKVIGLSLCLNGSTISEDMAYISTVCIRKEFRKKGIAQALLRHSFIEMKKAGKKKVFLHVDASSLTGATRLYKGVGMEVEKTHVKMEKVIKEGKSYRTENL